MEQEVPVKCRQRMMINLHSDKCPLSAGSSPPSNELYNMGLRKRRNAKDCIYPLEVSNSMNISHQICLTEYHLMLHFACSQHSEMIKWRVSLMFRSPCSGPDGSRTDCLRRLPGESPALDCTDERSDHVDHQIATLLGLLRRRRRHFVGCRCCRSVLLRRLQPPPTSDTRRLPQDGGRLTADVAGSHRRWLRRRLRGAVSEKDVFPFASTEV